jgi:hypothetical protein
MTPREMIRKEILSDAIRHGAVKFDGEITADNIEELYDELLVKEDLHWDYEDLFRCSGEETGIACERSRHYENKSVATKLSDGTWVGWTYWYGGGKHGEPDAFDWMGDAYFLDVKEEEKTVIVRTFKKKGVKGCL